MKKTLLTLIGILLVAVQAQAAPVELRFTSVYIDRHPVVQNAFIPWMEEIKKRTNGEVIIHYFNPGTICPEGEMFSAVASGAVDIASNTCNHTNGALPLNDAGNLPFLFNSAESAAMAIWRMSQQNPEWAAEFKDMKLLTQYTSALMMIHTAKKPVKSLDDLRGLKITTVGGLDRDVLRTFKASPILVSIPDTYMSLSRGMADGVYLAIAPLRSFKITECISYTTNEPIAASPMWMAMSKQAWERLSPDQQKVVEELSGEYLARLAGRALDEGVEADSRWMSEQGHTFLTLSPEEKANLVKATSGIAESWISKMEKLGKTNPRGIVEDLKKLGAETAAQVKAEQAAN